MRAFTLIELLTVIAIIGILAAIIIPVVGRVRESAKSAQCVSNLRQQGVAFMAYVNDHQQRYPLPWDGSNDPDNNWWARLAPYAGSPLPDRKLNATEWDLLKLAINSKTILGCPSTNVADTYPLSFVSYAMSGAHQKWAKDNGENIVGGKGVPASKIENPATALLVLESHEHPYFETYVATPSGATSSASPFKVVYPHRDKLNALFSDGHVKSFSSKQLEDRWNVFYEQAISQ